MKRLLTAVLLTASMMLASSAMAADDCYGDVNGDGVIDAADDDALKAIFGAQNGDADYLPGADLDGDGIIGGSDFLALQRAKADGC
jgi:hypothetical protein